MRSMLSVDADFSSQAVSSSLLSLVQLDSQGVGSHMVSSSRVDLMSELLNSGDGHDSLEMEDLSVALSSHGLGFGLFVFSLPFTNVSSLGLNLCLEEVGIVGSGRLLGLLVESSSSLLAVLDSSLANSLFGFILDQLVLEVDFLLSRCSRDLLVDSLDPDFDSDQRFLLAGNSASLLSDSSAEDLLEAKLSLDKSGSKDLLFGAGLAVSDSAGQALDGVLLVSHFDASDPDEGLMAAPSGSSVNDEFFVNVSPGLDVSLSGLLVQESDFLSDGSDRYLVSSLLLADV